MRFVQRASIFAAIEQQLGLRMIPQKGSIDMLVIDRVDRAPSETKRRNVLRMKRVYGS
jgi:uncharacterized protein (TIGR03435 family)